MKKNSKNPEISFSGKNIPVKPKVAEFGPI